MQLEDLFSRGLVEGSPIMISGHNGAQSVALVE
jgi:hypothetical protein